MDGSLAFVDFADRYHGIVWKSSWLELMSVLVRCRGFGCCLVGFPLTTLIFGRASIFEISL